MKKVVTIVMALFCAVILFFTFFGETLFYKAKPQVTIAYTYTVMAEDGEYKPLPAECVTSDGCVYVVNLTSGFSAQIATAEKREIAYWQLDDETVAVTFGLRNGEKIVVSSDRAFSDGDRVTVVE